MIDSQLPEFWDRLESFDGSVVPDWLIDRQRRSRATRERILRTADALIRDRPFADVSMQDLADRAGVSIGAVYARFPSKESVLALLGLVAFDGTRARFERALEDLPELCGLEAVARTYTEILVAEFSSHKCLVREVRRHASDSPELRELMRRTNRAIHEAFLDRAGRCGAEIRHPEPTKALRYGLFLMNAGAREAILSNALDIYDVKGDRAELVVELTRSFCGYLGVGDPSEGGAS